MKFWSSNVAGDIVGGFVSAVVAIPLAMGFGMFAFVALGDQYFANGALAGLYTACIVGVVAVVLGDRTTTVYAPRIGSTFFLGLLMFRLAHADAAIIQTGGLPLILALIFAIVLLGGAFQFLFGLVRLGTLIKYSPHPVMAGFQNAAALLLFLVQLGNVLGFDRSVSFVDALHHVEGARPLSVVIALVTFVAMWNARKLLPKVPPLIVGLAAGIGLYYACVGLGLAGALGPVIGSGPPEPFGASRIPDFSLLFARDLMALLPTIVSGALALAIIASIDALLCAKLAARPGDTRIAGDRLLMRLGLGNMASAGLSGITSGINIGASTTNRAFGGRTPVSVLVNALVLFLTIAVLFPVVEQLPRVVLSAVIMVIAVQHVDPWTLRHLGRLVAGKTDYRLRTATELAVVVLVAVLAITVDIVLAVFLGVAIAIVLFLVSMSRSIVRRTFRCDTFRSRRSRDPAQLAVLERDGGAIQVMELQGALFFGSAEKLANEVAAAEAQGIRYFVLDLRRVTEIDSTGSQILAEIDAGLAAKDKSLVLALAKQSETAVQLADFELLDPAAASRTFRDVDRAIEWAEDHLLADRRKADSDKEIPLERFDILRGFTADDLETIRRHASRAVHAGGQMIFREGEPGRDLFLIAKGTASAHLHQADGGDVRLATFGPGTVFGELAILDDGVRSASVTADGELVCHVLSATGFAALSREAPAVAIKLLANLGRELSGRLRRANTALRQLES